MSEFPGEASNHDRYGNMAHDAWHPPDSSEDENDAIAPYSQPEVEHWYRGEGRDGGGRNGGRGEIQAADREMLTIALSGHIPADYRARDSWKLEDAEHSDSQEPWRGQTQDDYVLDERMLTDMEGENDGTDADTVERSTTPTATSHPLPNAETPKASLHTTPRPVPRTQTQATPTKLHSLPKANGTSPQSTIRATPTPTKGPARGKRKMSLPPRSNPPASRSAYDLSSPALADAIPPWEVEPSVPPSGNWDEVVLPTIAKKMRMAQSGSAPAVSMLGSQTSPAARSASSPTTMMIPPAPGTFDYDASKANHRHQVNKAPPQVDQFGAHLSPSSSERPTSIVFPQVESMQMMETPLPSSVGATQNSSHNMPTRNTTKDLRKTKPQIRVTSPSMKSHRDVEDPDSGGCCKCIIM